MNMKLPGSLKQQSYVPLENVTTHVTNKYEAIVVAAAEARKINSVLRMVGRDEAQEKVTSRALRRICTGDIDYVYLDESARIAEAEALSEEAANAAAAAAAAAAADIAPPKAATQTAVAATPEVVPEAAVAPTVTPTVTPTPVADSEPVVSAEPVKESGDGETPEAS